jgi:hypothetical protein
MRVLLAPRAEGASRLRRGRGPGEGGEDTGSRHAGAVARRPLDAAVRGDGGRLALERHADELALPSQAAHGQPETRGHAAREIRDRLIEQRRAESRTIVVHDSAHPRAAPTD